MYRLSTEQGMGFWGAVIGAGTSFFGSLFGGGEETALPRMIDILKSKASQTGYPAAHPYWGDALYVTPSGDSSKLASNVPSWEAFEELVQSESDSINSPIWIYWGGSKESDQYDPNAWELVEPERVLQAGFLGSGDTSILTLLALGAGGILLWKGFKI